MQITDMLAQMGGLQSMARELGISEALLARFLQDSRPLPDRLLLRAVDLILADRQSRPLPTPPPVLRPSEGELRDD